MVAPAGATSAPKDASERVEMVERLLTDPPAVHPLDDSPNPRVGVWSTDPTCYHFIARQCEPGTRTLETGCGMSTAVFALCGAVHRCVSPGEIESNGMVAYCERHGIATDTITFNVAFSHDALPQLDLDEVDLVFIDGCHGYPMPVLDWFYAGSHLRRGGTLVVDDVQLPAVKALLAFLDADPRWTSLVRHEFWSAYRRESAGSLLEDWTSQPFYTARAIPAVRDVAVAKLRPVVRRVRRVIKRVRG